MVEMTSTPEISRSIKCVVVGDSNVGKTSLLSRYCRGVFPVNHVPTFFDDDSATMMIGNERVELMLFDTTGQTEFNRMRFITYPGTDVVIVCFSVVRASSLDSVINRWLPELDVYCPPTVPVLLVGTQVDLRPATAARAGDHHRHRRGPATAADLVATVRREHGARTAKKIGADGYVECSALSGAGLADVFVEAVKAALNAAVSTRRRRRRSSSCSSKSVFFDAASSLVCWRTTTV